MRELIGKLRPTEMAAITARAKELAQTRGHRDIFAEIVTATGRRRAVWEFYIDDARSQLSDNYQGKGE